MMYKDNRHCDFMQHFRGFLVGPNHCPGCAGCGITARGTVCKACLGDGKLSTAVRGYSTRDVESVAVGDGEEQRAMSPSTPLASVRVTATRSRPETSAGCGAPAATAVKVHVPAGEMSRYVSLDAENVTGVAATETAAPAILAIVSSTVRERPVPAPSSRPPPREM